MLHERKPTGNGWPATSSEVRVPGLESSPEREKRFVVRAEGSDLVKDWLSVHRDIIYYPRFPFAERTGMATSLDLGEVRIGGRLLDVARASLEIDPTSELYQTTLQLLPASKARRTLGHQPFEKVGPLDKDVFMEKLTTSPLAEKYTYAIDETSERLQIGYKDQESAPDSQPTFEFQAVDFGQNVGYVLTMTQKGLSDEHLDEFPQRYEEFAELSKEMIDALYHAYQLEIPERTFTIEPPLNTKKIISTANTLMARMYERVEREEANDTTQTTSDALQVGFVMQK